MCEWRNVKSHNNEGFYHSFPLYVLPHCFTLLMSFNNIRRRVRSSLVSCLPPPTSIGSVHTFTLLVPVASLRSSTVPKIEWEKELNAMKWVNGARLRNRGKGTKEEDNRNKKREDNPPLVLVNREGCRSCCFPSFSRPPFPYCPFPSLTPFSCSLRLSSSGERAVSGSETQGTNPTCGSCSMGYIPPLDPFPTHWFTPLI